MQWPERANCCVFGAQFYVIYLMKGKFRHTYSSSYDTFRIGWLVGLCAVLAVVLHYSFAFEGSAFVVFLYDIQELLWTFSIYLESVAILPQLFLLQRTGEAEALTADYVFCLGGYRFLYIFNWIWRAAHTPGYQDWIVWVSGFIQTALYGDFFYYYVKCKYCESRRSAAAPAPSPSPSLCRRRWPSSAPGVTWPIFVGRWRRGQAAAVEGSQRAGNGSQTAVDVGRRARRRLRDGRCLQGRDCLFAHLTGLRTLSRCRARPRRQAARQRAALRCPRPP